MIFFRGQTIFQRSVISAAENAVLLLPGGVAIDCYEHSDEEVFLFRIRKELNVSISGIFTACKKLSRIRDKLRKQGISIYPILMQAQND